jgi:hypothetical protein
MFDNAPQYTKTFSVRKNSWEWTDHYRVTTTIADREFYGDMLREFYAAAQKINSGFPKAVKEFNLEFAAITVEKASHYDYSMGVPEFKKIETIEIEYLLLLAKVIKQAERVK